MKTTRLLLLSVCSSMLLPSTAHARNVKLILPIAAAVETKDVPDKPTGAVKFFFAGQTTPKVLASLGTYIVRPGTAAMGKSDERACYEALQWSLVALEKRAQQVGAKAVVHIVSYYRNTEMSSATEFECHVGNVVVSVVLKGDLVKIAEE